VLLDNLTEPFDFNILNTWFYIVLYTYSVLIMLGSINGTGDHEVL